MRKAFCFMFVVSMICGGCIYRISDETKTLARDVHTYAVIQKAHVQDVVSGRRIGDDKAKEMLINAEALADTTKNLSDILGKPKK